MADVKQYGAVGDGVADDSAAFQAAFNAESDLYIPPGVYLVGGLTAVRPLSIRGANPVASVLRHRGGSTVPMLRAMPAAALPCLALRDIGIDGNKTQQAAHLHTTELAADDIEITNCRFRDTVRTAVHVTDCGVLRMDGCDFAGMAEGRNDLPGHGDSQAVLVHLIRERGVAWFTRNLVVGSVPAAPGFAPGGFVTNPGATTTRQLRCVVEGNEFSLLGQQIPGPYTTGPLYLYSNADSSMVAGNSFDRCTTYVLSVQRAEMVTIAGNVIRGVMPGSEGVILGAIRYSGRKPVKPQRGCVISGNTVFDWPGTGIDLQGDLGGELSDVVLVGNAVRSTGKPLKKNAYVTCREVGNSWQ